MPCTEHCWSMSIQQWTVETYSTLIPWIQCGWRGHTSPPPLLQFARWSVVHPGQLSSVCCLVQFLLGSYEHSNHNLQRLFRGSDLSPAEGEMKQATAQCCVKVKKRDATAVYSALTLRHITQCSHMMLMLLSFDYGHCSCTLPPSYGWNVSFAHQMFHNLRLCSNRQQHWMKKPTLFPRNIVMSTKLQHQICLAKNIILHDHVFS